MLFNECTSSNLIIWHQESTKLIVGSETNKNRNFTLWQGKTPAISGKECGTPQLISVRNKNMIETGNKYFP